MPRLFVAAFAGVLLSTLASVAAEPIPIVAAENFYGEVAAAVGGDRVAVENVLVNPDVDPHDFEPSPSVARGIADARIVLFNGADYDHWVKQLLEASERQGRVVIEAAALIGAKEGDNPHVWYDPRTMPAVADALTKALTEIDPDGAAGYEARRAAYVASLAPLQMKVKNMRDRFAGLPITATEPVFGYMADALGLTMGNGEFQTAIMNETEPSAKAVAKMIDDIRGNKVKVLIYNRQVTDAMTEQLLAAAQEAKVPVVGVSETLPVGLTYPQWMDSQLDALEKALAGPSS
ncbi:MAG: zinc ABC transporter substrate-binding protein [Bauldia sp.]